MRKKISHARTTPKLIECRKQRAGQMYALANAARSDIALSGVLGLELSVIRGRGIVLLPGDTDKSGCSE